MRTRGQGGLFWPAVAGLAAVALALRVAAAGGPLWLDELVSLSFATGAAGTDGVFTLHDNNHLLNTLWLALVGPDAPPRLQRALSILLGTAAVPLAALLMRRRGAAAAIAAAAVFALAVPLVIYGSEARGYAGLVVATLTLFIAADRHLHDGSAGARWLAAGATAVGLAFQPLTALACVAMAGTVLVTHLRRTRDLDAAVKRSVAFLWPSMAVGIAVVAVVAVGAARSGIAFGGVVPFTVDNLASGYTAFIAAILGLPPSLALWSAGPAVLVLALVALRREATDSDGPLLLATLVLAPAMFLLARPPNVEMVRYHMDAGIGALIALVLAGRSLSTAGGWGRAAAGLIAVAFLAAQGSALLAFLAAGRGQPQPMISAAAAGLPDPVRVASSRPKLVVYYLRGAARADGRSYAMLEALDCVRPPDLVVEWNGDDPPPALEGADAPCGIPYLRTGRTEAYWLSGMAFTVYRRADLP